MTHREVDLAGDGVVDPSVAQAAVASVAVATIGIARAWAEHAPRGRSRRPAPGVAPAPDPPAPGLIRTPEGTSYAGPVLGRAFAVRSTGVGSRSRWDVFAEHVTRRRPDDACEQCGALCTVLLENGCVMYADHEFWTELSCASCDAGSPLALAAAWDGDRWILPLPAAPDVTLRREAVDVAADQFLRAFGEQRPGLAVPTHELARRLWSTCAPEYSRRPQVQLWGRRPLLVELLNPGIGAESAMRHLTHVADGDPWVPAAPPVPSESAPSSAYDQLLVEARLLETELLALPRIDRHTYTGREEGLSTSWDVTAGEPVLRCWARAHDVASDTGEVRHDWIITMDGAVQARGGSPSSASHPAFWICDLPANERWFLLRDHLLRTAGEASALWEPPSGSAAERVGRRAVDAHGRADHAGAARHPPGARRGSRAHLRGHAAAAAVRVVDPDPAVRRLHGRVVARSRRPLPRRHPDARPGPRAGRGACTARSRPALGSDV
jgi:hypothetical protein